MSQSEIAGKTFLITGGASGLGLLYVEAFLKEGAKGVAIADIAEEIGKATAARLNSAYPGKVTFLKCDVSSEEQIAATFDQVVTHFQQLDVLINNAGIMSDAPKLWRTACDVNWQGLVSFTMRAVKHMAENEGGAGGTIINISSIAGLTTFKALPAYAGSKAAVLHFSMSISEAPFFEQTGVRIMTLCPGATDTPLLHDLTSRAYNKRVGQELTAEYEEISKVVPAQKPESAAVACVKVFKEGAPGSVWLTTYNKPAKDITPQITKYHDDLTNIMLALAN